MGIELDERPIVATDTGSRIPTPMFVTDTREQKPYKFKHSTRAALKTGDYSVAGMENLVTVERKTKSDAYSSLGQDRGRFQREFERLAEFDYAALVIEASLRGFLTPPAFSKLNPNSAIATLLAWSVRYGVHVFFASDRQHGNKLTRQILLKYWQYNRGELNE